MLPFGDAVVAWRLSRGMTQAALARAAHVPRPNLSAIERGDRDVTLRTLRAIALALDVRPGVLADGLAPQERKVLGRPEMERVARATTRGAGAEAPHEEMLARHLRAATATRRAGGTRRRRQAGAAGDRAYFRLRTLVDAPTLASLIDRVGVDLDRA
jgi:transcriptional regulator with XRE-family HTH domain